MTQLAARTFPDLVASELATARQGHGDINTHHEGFAVILKEVEEFKDEVFKKMEERSSYHLLSELVQIAAMAQRVAEDCSLISSVHAPRPTRRIIVNGDEKTVAEAEFSFDEIASMVCDGYSPGGFPLLTVTYRNGPPENPVGVLSPGQKIKVAEGMIIDATFTNNA